MKIILSIIFMFFSAKSFADLEGKALICKWERLITGFTFERNYKYYRYWIGLKNDTYRVYISPLHNYKIEPDWIVLYLGTSINRKTLKIYDNAWNDKGICELAKYDTIKSRVEKHKNKLQEEYNKKLEGNKI